MGETHAHAVYVTLVEIPAMSSPAATVASSIAVSILQSIFASQIAWYTRTVVVVHRQWRPRVLWHSPTIGLQVVARNVLIVSSKEFLCALGNLLVCQTAIGRAKLGGQQRVEGNGKRIHPTLSLDKAERVGDLESGLVWVGVARVREVVPALVRTERSICLPCIPKLAFYPVRFNARWVYCCVVDVKYARPGIAIGLLIAKIDDDEVAVTAAAAPRDSIMTCATRYCMR